MMIKKNEKVKKKYQKDYKCKWRVSCVIMADQTVH